MAFITFMTAFLALIRQRPLEFWGLAQLNPNLSLFVGQKFD